MVVELIVTALEYAVQVEPPLVEYSALATPLPPVSVPAVMVTLVLAFVQLTLGFLVSFGAAGFVLSMFTCMLPLAETLPALSIVRAYTVVVELTVIALE